MLQRCRSWLAAEITPGDPSARQRCWLQRCRSWLAAEMGMSTSDPFRSRMLQRCRSWLAAEITWMRWPPSTPTPLQRCRSWLAAEMVPCRPVAGPRKRFNGAAAGWLRRWLPCRLSKYGTVLLQRCRSWLAAEIAMAELRTRTQLAASTVPQLVGCGDPDPHGQRLGLGGASTVPQLVGCGDSTTFRSLKELREASTVPQLVGCGDTAPATAPAPALQRCRSWLAAEIPRPAAARPAAGVASTVPQLVGCGDGAASPDQPAATVLQRCRSWLAAEISCTSELARRRASFNGAAAGWLRRYASGVPGGRGVRDGFNGAAAGWLRRWDNLADWLEGQYASTVPQLVGCGDAGDGRAGARRLYRFNGAAAGWLRRSRRPSPGGRCRKCFNGAAAGWLRR